MALPASALRPGRLRELKKYRVNIPAGVRDGSKIRLAGKGEAGVRGQPPSHRAVVVYHPPHDRVAEAEPPRPRLGPYQVAGDEAVDRFENRVMAESAGGDDVVLIERVTGHGRGAGDEHVVGGDPVQFTDHRGA